MRAGSRDASGEPRQLTAPSVGALWLLGTALLWALYAFVFVQTGAAPPASAAVDALANVLPLALLAVAVRAVLKTHVMSLSWPVQAASHVGLGLGFATAWYATVLVLLAFAAGLQGRGFAVSGFQGPAFTWQVFQGLILYAAIAAVCYAMRGGRDAAVVTLDSAPARRPPLTRYLIRRGEEMIPVDVREIVSIAGAQDYAEVATAAGRHLVRLSLGEFEARLDPQDFVRVHRSAIIRLDRLVRTEPAGGGRLLAHMQGGDVVQVSRAGAQALRRLVV